MFEKLIVFVLGSQVNRKKNGAYGLQLHTAERVRAASILLLNGKAHHVIFLGGPTYLTRYDENHLIPFDFSKDTLQKAIKELPEAQVMANIAKEKYGISEKDITVEPFSLCTEDQIKMIVLLTTQLKIKALFGGQIGLLTSQSHIDRAYGMLVPALHGYEIQVIPFTAEIVVKTEEMLQGSQ